MTTNERQQRMAERILEDEMLRGDLEDEAATALIDWASAQAAAAAADTARTDAVVEADVQAIRQAARAAALSGETEPKRLIALAAAGLAPSHDVAQDAPVAATSAAASAEPAVVAEVSIGQSAAPPADVPPALDAAPAPVVAALPAAPPTPSAPAADLVGDAAPKPVNPAGPRPRHKRSRLARFFRHLLGGH